MAFRDGFKHIAKGMVKGSIEWAVIKFVQDQLERQIKNQIINNLVKMIIFLTAVLVSGFSLFGRQVSLFVSSVILAGLLVHSVIHTVPKIIRLIDTLIDYRVVGIIPRLFDKDITATKLVAHYISSWGSLATALKNKFDIIAKDWVPSADKLFDDIKVYVGARFLVFMVTLVIYFVLFNFIIKPLLQLSSMGAAGLKVYALPFSMAIDFLFKTKTTQWITG